MDHFRLRKYRGPEIWARVRDGYVAGESGPSLARRFDVGLANLRKKAMAEGWTRNRIAERLDRELEPSRPRPPLGAVAHGAGPLDPAATLADAMQAAAILLREGRGAEASATVRAAQAFADLAGVRPPTPASPPEPTEDELAAREAERREHWEAFQSEITRRAHSLAVNMVSDKVTVSGVLGAFAYRWRAANLGSDVAAADYRQACEFSSHPKHWDKDGNLIPITVEWDRHWARDRHLLMSAGTDQK
jgi:hypothetical protein